eukprot:CAMPEP_0172800604 /NCGR_PEP_ID=MMETSP1075-20121228/2693_1 /TAXON_ID=2916 /ORGANISM="Ceratium fusus, Strain PA161109" /LENGTH=249 /DNA_ID=CAMNT_0013638541 /DNA_START=110 /DNA_END=856 /DNA_ORIENTATION=+
MVWSAATETTKAGNESASETVKCECLSWFFLRRNPRKERFMELMAWRRFSWSEPSTATGRSATNLGSQHGGGGISGVGPRRSLNPLVQDVQLPCGLLPSQVSELLDRDITPDDYDMLLQLDHANQRPTASAEIVERLPASDAKAAIGESCAVCLLSFQSDDDLALLAASTSSTASAFRSGSWSAAGFVLSAAWRLTLPQRLESEHMRSSAVAMVVPARTATHIKPAGRGHKSEGMPYHCGSGGDGGAGG